MLLHHSCRLEVGAATMQNSDQRLIAGSAMMFDTLSSGERERERNRVSGRCTYDLKPISLVSDSLRMLYNSKTVFCLEAFAGQGPFS